MLKYYFRPLASALEGTKIESEGNKDTILVVISAESREQAVEFGKSIVDMAQWELSHSEE